MQGAEFRRDPTMTGCGFTTNIAHEKPATPCGRGGRNLRGLRLQPRRTGYRERSPFLQSDNKNHLLRKEPFQPSPAQCRGRIMSLTDCDINGTYQAARESTPDNVSSGPTRVGRR